MTQNVKSKSRIVLVILGFLSCFPGSPAQRDKRVQQQQQVTQTNPLVRAFRGRGKSEKDLVRGSRGPAALRKEQRLCVEDSQNPPN
jgi:hypothetical protein